MKAQLNANRFRLQRRHGGGVLVKIFVAFVALIFPDLQLFNLVDDIVAGTAIPMALFAKTAVLGIVYTSVYLFFAWVSFHGKEL